MVFGGLEQDDVFNTRSIHRAKLPLPKRSKGMPRPPFLASHYRPEMEEKLDKMSLVDKVVRLGINSLVGLATVGIVVVFTMNILSFYR